MKSPLVYLTVKRLKNYLREMVKRPAKLIYIVSIAALLVFMAFSGSLSEPETGQFRDFSELWAMATVLYTAMFLLIFVTGSAGNTAMFTLSDVTLLFSSPISSTRILFYGLLRQMVNSLLLGFFLLFQYSWMHSLYGISYVQLAVIVVGYALTLFMAQLSAMAVYTRTSSLENSGRWIKGFAYGSVILYLLGAAFSCREPLAALLSGGKDFNALLPSASSFLSSFPGLLFPVSGWISAIVMGGLAGDWTVLIIGAGLILVLFFLLLWLLAKSKSDYYEDALQSAEVAQSAITAQKEGQLAETAPKHVRLGKTGLKKGWGASAIYYKHKVENRRSGVFFLSNISLIFAIGIILFAFFFREEGSTMMIGAFAMGTYMQLFSEALGRFNRELIKPYVYLIPEPPLKKMLFAIGENVETSVLEAVVIFVPVGLILGASPLDTALCILGRISFSLLFTAGNVLVERVFGTVSSKALIFLFYFLALLVMVLPGIGLGIALSIFCSFLPGFLPFFLGMVPMNILVSLLTLYCCKGLLQYAELNNR